MTGGRQARPPLVFAAACLPLVLALALALPASRAAHAQDTSRSGEFGHPADAYLQYSLSGADFSGDETEDFVFEGIYTGGTISFSGTMIVSRDQTSSYVTMTASLGEQSKSWPPEGEDSKVHERTVELPFSFSYTPARGPTDSTVTGGARLEVCGTSTCGVYAISFVITVPEEKAGAGEPGDESVTAGDGEDGGLVPIGFGPLEAVPGPDGLIETLGGVLGPALIGLIIAVAGGTMGGAAPPPVPVPGGGVPGPRGHHGQTRTWTGEDGRTHTEKYDAVTDTWLSPQAWAADAGTRKAFSDAIDEDRAANEDLIIRRQNLQKFLDRYKARMDLLTKLQQTRRKALDYGIGESGGPGDVQGKLDRMIRDLAGGKLPDSDEIDRINRVIESQSSGRSLDSRHINPHALEVNTTSWMVRGAGATAKEVITGVDLDGNTSWRSLILRGGITAVSGGTADLVYTGAEWAVLVKNGLDQGQATSEAIFNATKQAAVDELIAAGIAKGLTAGGKALTNTFPGLEKPISGGGRARPPRATRPPAGGRPRRPPAPRPSADEVRKAIAEAKAKRAAHTPSYAAAPDANIPSMTRGMPPKSVKHVQMIADKHGVQIHVRQTNPDARKWLESGRGVPKREFIKNKTINEVDELLGAPKGSRGLAGSFEPRLPDTKPPGITDATWSKMKDRYGKRMQEWTDQKVHLNDLKAKGKIEIRDGVIFDKKSGGRPMAGDQDIFDIRGHDGRPVPDAVKNQVVQDLKGPPFGAQHGDHMSWDYTNKSRATPKAGYGPPSARQSAYDVAHGIDNKILDSHSRGIAGRPGEPLITINPDGPPTGSYYTGGRRG